jgi:6-phosphogluconolactonase
VHIFFSDERHVPPDDASSNYRMARETLLSRVPIPEGNVERIRSEWPPEEAARDYEGRIREVFGLARGDLPRFDLILLGMGADGHTASLFPGSTALHETESLVAAPRVDKLVSHRFTLTPVTINRAASVIFLVSGEEKAEALRNVLEGVHDPDRLPAQIVNPVDGDLLWLIDSAAGRLLSRHA